MGNATKVALVALLILMVVVVARFVREDTAVPDGAASEAKVTGTKPSTTGKQAPESVAKTRVTPNPGVRRIEPTTRQPVSPTRPAADGGVASRSAGPTGTTPAAAPAGSPPESTAAAAVVTAPPQGSGPATASQPSTPEARPPSSVTATPGTAVADRPPPIPRSSTGEPLPAPLPPAPQVGQEPSGSRAGTPGRSLAQDTATAPGTPTALVNSHLRRNEGGDLTGGVSDRPSQPAPSTDRSGSSTPSYGDLARGEAGSRSAEASRPAPSPGAAVRPAASSDGYPKTHTVVKGDSYWGLAQKYYGNGKLGTLIEKENPGIPVQPGKKLSIPEPPPRPAETVAPARVERERTVAEAPAPREPSRDLYVVQRGDTLGKIAQRFYGDAGKSELIEDANPHLRYQILQAGAKIKIPPRP